MADNVQGEFHQFSGPPSSDDASFHLNNPDEGISSGVPPIGNSGFQTARTDVPVYQASWYDTDDSGALSLPDNPQPDESSGNENKQPNVQTEPLQNRLFPFLSPENYLFASSHQNAFMTMAEKWAGQLPKGKILDAAAGTGVDSLQLLEKGYDAEALDLSAQMVRRNLMPAGRVKVGNVLELPYGGAALSGILLKDVFALLSPEQKKQVFREMYRTLVDSGEVLVSSHIQDRTIAEVITETPLAAEPFSLQTFTMDNPAWFSEEIRRAEQGDGRIVSLLWETNPEMIRALAAQNGFEVTLQISYGRFHPFALENRWNTLWNTNPGFIFFLRKSAEDDEDSI